MTRNPLQIFAKIVTYLLLGAVGTIGLWALIAILSELGGKMGGPAQEATEQGIDASMLWETYSPSVIQVFLIVLVVLIGYGGYRYLQDIERPA